MLLIEINGNCQINIFRSHTPRFRGTYGVPNAVRIYDSNRAMPGSASSLPGLSPSEQASHQIHWVSTNPSSVSRLGDVGYTCRKGNWRRVVNITDSYGCKSVGIRPICSTEGLATTEQAPLTDPYVQLSAGSFQLLSPENQEKYVNLVCLLKFSLTDSESAINEDGTDMDNLQSKLRLVINPPVNRIATAFLAGPYITVRALEVPRSLVTEWLRVHHSRLRKATRETMKLWPTESGRLAVSLCLIEFVTESWRTIILGSVATPSPIVVVWNTGPQDGCGEWKVIDMPDSPTKVTGGLGSAQVLSFTLWDS